MSNLHQKLIKTKNFHKNVFLRHKRSTHGHYSKQSNRRLLLFASVGPNHSGALVRRIDVGRLWGLRLKTAGSLYRQHQKNPKDTTIPNWSQLSEGVQRSIQWNERLEDRWLTDDATATLTRLFAGLGLAVVGSCVLGIAMGCSQSVEAFLAPPLSFLAKVPGNRRHCRVHGPGGLGDENVLSP